MKVPVHYFGRPAGKSHAQSILDQISKAGGWYQEAVDAIQADPDAMRRFEETMCWVDDAVTALHTHGAVALKVNGETVDVIKVQDFYNLDRENEGCT